MSHWWVARGGLAMSVKIVDLDPENNLSRFDDIHKSPNFHGFRTSCDPEVHSVDMSKNLQKRWTLVGILRPTVLNQLFDIVMKVIMDWQTFFGHNKLALQFE
jgi:hypothetical protein